MLELGVTDALDDLEADEENVQSKGNIEKHQQKEIHDNKSVEIEPIHKQNEQIISQEKQDHHSEEEPDIPIVRPKADLREKLREKSNSHREALSASQAVEDDDGEEAKERRNRFQSERIMIPTKMNHEIPDSLENVVTSEQHRSHYRNRDRGDRGDRNDRIDRDRSDRDRIDRDRNDRDRSDRERCDKGERNERGDRGERDRGDRGDRRNIRGRSGGRYDTHPSNR